MKCGYKRIPKECVKKVYEDKSSPYYQTPNEWCISCKKAVDVRSASDEPIIHHCKLVTYGSDEKRCIKCGYITWSNNKSDAEIIEDMINAGYDVTNCDNDA